jgi:hypothetical protein
MNKRLLAGVAAAGIIGGGVYGFAATLTPTSDTVGAGSSVVASCDDAVDVDYTVAWDTNRYEVATVTVNGIAAGCAGDNIGVTLLGEATPKTATQQELTTTSATFDVSALNVGATVLNNVHVVIAG